MLLSNDIIINLSIVESLIHQTAFNLSSDFIWETKSLKSRKHSRLIFKSMLTKTLAYSIIGKISIFMDFDVIHKTFSRTLMLSDNLPKNTSY